ncbi:hypothetical protein Pan97_49710 [Bremerella volcania]|uniref:Uncharacterized protein n=1 Tax=Bremerella volcania TaxID=2527984 RepID=A0A518CF84_9BACT|nr:hypothetical protein [Bremerella volcania]QDU77892.1 hypothetical protein Pan97_49710 [Bremerella volcania]
MDHSTPFKLVHEPPKTPTGNFVVYQALPEDSLTQLSDWMDHALEILEEENVHFVSPNSSRKHLVSSR